MTAPTRSRPSVIALAASSRASAILFLVLAVPIVVVTIALAANAIITAVVTIVGGAVWAGLMMLFLRSGIADPPPPVAVSRAELPRVASLWRQLAWQAGPMVVVSGAVTCWYAAHPAQPPAPVGILLGAPALSWYQHRRARRVERDLGGELYVTQFARRRNRRSYVVRPGEDVAEARASQPAA